MRYLKAICGFAVVALVLSGCGGGSASSPNAAASSASATGSATLNWKAPTTNTNGSALDNLAGYHIYYGTSAGSMTHSVDVANAGTTTYVIDNLAPGTWYFGITAYTNTGVQSGMSNVGSKTIT